MQDLEDDMDEFIRKAARDYPFHQHEDAWSYVARKIDSVESKGYRLTGWQVNVYNYKKFLISLFVILLSGFFFMILESHPSEIQMKKIAWGAKNPDFLNDRLLKGLPAVRVNKTLHSIPESFQKTNQAAMTEQSVESTRLINDKGIEAKQIESDIPIHKDPDSLIAHPFRIDSRSVGKGELTEIDIKKKRTLFYLGVTAGPQFNQVNNQGLSRVGWSLGLLAGFQINKKLSLETGVNFTQKQYHTRGEYFNMQELSGSMPPGMKIVSLVGKSYVTEIPLMIKYDVLTSGNSRIFVSGGISSYILTKETNQYKVLLNGSSQKMTGNYSKTSSYYAASANFSMGYENQISNGIRMRIAPYVQIPMTGFGVGALHILSTGVNLGITVPLIRK